MKHSMVCEELATSLFKEFNKNLTSSSSSTQNEPILLILDRRLDPVTPILNQVFRKWVAFYIFIADFFSTQNIGSAKERVVLL